ncbi:HAD family hydrolase [Cohnella hongkongensis]|uniref:HAD family hydrolase n=1 Tax=Cohnella hongkongensis TaxID=178337 RepID=A0ABV9F6N8_9BACL
MIKAIIFDFDGTIIDTETAWYQAFREAYLSHGVELTLEQYSQCIGTSLHRFNPYEYLMTELGLPIDKEAFRENIHDNHAKRMEEETVRPGVLSYLESAKALGLKIGLASSSSEQWVRSHLDRLKLTDYFECIRTADHVSRVKPDPELYLQALSGLGVRPEEAVAIEDSPNGARAAAAAGLICVVVPNVLTETLSFPRAHYRADSLTDIDFRRLVGRAAVS